MKILWLSPRWPFPDNTGARKATMALLSEMNSAASALNISNFDLKIVALYDGEEELKTASEFERLTGTHGNLYLPKPKLPRNSNALAFLQTRIFHPTMPFTIQKYTNTLLEEGMRNWLSGKQFDVTVIDGLHGAAFVDLSDSRYGRFIHRAHNVESDLWRQLKDQESNPAKKLVWSLEKVLSEKFELSVCRRSEMTFAVSEMDR
ncbi:MAG: hypothetical protein EOP09_09535, partial [Proteobacteria bacterium]